MTCDALVLAAANVEWVIGGLNWYFISLIVQCTRRASIRRRGCIPESCAEGTYGSPWRRVALEPVFSSTQEGSRGLWHPWQRWGRQVEPGSWKTPSPAATGPSSARLPGQRRCRTAASSRGAAFPTRHFWSNTSPSTVYNLLNLHTTLPDELWRNFPTIIYSAFHVVISATQSGRFLICKDKAYPYMKRKIKSNYLENNETNLWRYVSLDNLIVPCNGIHAAPPPHIHCSFILLQY